MSNRGSILPQDSRVTWAAAAAVAAMIVTVTGGVLKVEAAMDERFDRFEQKVDAGDAAVKADIRREVREVYAKKNEVAREPVEHSEVEGLKESLVKIEKRFDGLDGKLDRLLGYNRRRTQ